MINPTYKVMTRLSMDLYMVPRYHKGHRFISVVIGEVTTFMVATPIHQSQSENIGDALLEHVFSKYSTVEYMIVDQDGTFTSTLIKY